MEMDQYKLSDELKRERENGNGKNLWRSRQVSFTIHQGKHNSTALWTVGGGDEGFDRLMFSAIEVAIIRKGQVRDKPSST